MPSEGSSSDVEAIHGFRPELVNYNIPLFDGTWFNDWAMHMKHKIQLQGGDSYILPPPSRYDRNREYQEKAIAVSGTAKEKARLHSRKLEDIRIQHLIMANVSTKIMWELRQQQLKDARHMWAYMWKHYGK